MLQISIFSDKIKESLVFWKFFDGLGLSNLFAHINTLVDIQSGQLFRINVMPEPQMRIPVYDFLAFLKRQNGLLILRK